MELREARPCHPPLKCPPPPSLYIFVVKFSNVFYLGVLYLFLQPTPTFLSSSNTPPPNLLCVHVLRPYTHLLFILMISCCYWLFHLAARALLYVFSCLPLNDHPRSHGSHMTTASLLELSRQCTEVVCIHSIKKDGQTQVLVVRSLF